jgi:hypothetical protein
LVEIINQLDATSGDFADSVYQGLSLRYQELALA